MKDIFTQLTHKLRIAVYVSVAVLLTIYEITYATVYNLSVKQGIIAFFVSVAIAVVITEIALYFVAKKERELQRQIRKLADAYEYIGIVNRKFDLLLDLQHPPKEYLLHSPHLAREKTKELLNNLQTITGAHTVFFATTPTAGEPLKVISQRTIVPSIKNIIQKLEVLPISLIRNSENEEDRDFFLSVGIPKEQLDSHTIFVKPVYFNNVDLGYILFIDTTKREMDEITIKIIRLFSFYLSVLHFNREETLEIKS